MKKNRGQKRTHSPSAAATTTTTTGASSNGNKPQSAAAARSSEAARLASEFVAWDAELGVPCLPLPALVQLQRKLGAVAGLVQDAVVRAAAAAAERRELLVCASDALAWPTRVRQRSRLQRLAFDAATGALSVCDGGAAATEGESSFVECERVVEARFELGVARQPFVALLFHSQSTAAETIHYRFARGDLPAVPPEGASDDAAAGDAMFARVCGALQQRVDSAAVDGLLLFEWHAVRRFDGDALRQTQHVPADARASAAFARNIAALSGVGGGGGEGDDVDARVGRNVVLRCLQLEAQLRVWNVLEHDIDACFALAAPRQSVEHSVVAKRAGLVYV